MAKSSSRIKIVRISPSVFDCIYESVFCFSRFYCCCRAAEQSKFCSCQNPFAIFVTICIIESRPFFHLICLLLPHVTIQLIHVPFQLHAHQSKAKKGRSKYSGYADLTTTTQHSPTKQPVHV